MAAGGDGTINEVANGLARAGREDVALGILPIGTANVLAIEAGIPRRVERAARVLATGTPRPLYLGEVVPENHYEEDIRRFVLMAGAGFDAHVIETVDLRLKRRIGRFAYVWSALTRVLSYPFPMNDLEVQTIDGDIERVSGATVIICNGRHYGGAYVAAPSADISKPSFQVVVSERPGILNMARYAWGLGAGRLSRFPDIRILEATSVRLPGNQLKTLQLDGDAHTTRISEIKVAARPLSLIVPDLAIAKAA